MAKKKSTAKSVSSDTSEPVATAEKGSPGRRTFDDLPADVAISLAWPVASVVNVENLIVEEFHAKRSPEGYRPEDDMAINLDISEIGIGRDEAHKRLFVKISLKAQIAKKTAPEESDPAARIECTFVLIYAVSSFEGLEDAQLTAFAQTSGIFNVWPYWRQIIHTTSLHLGLPALVIPTHRANDPAPHPDR